ncbi:MAG: AAA family ATPase [Deltaproteobacteria bacterium]|nr:AAA family ATPase [Deltaproteobacteria bacterium]
MATARIEEMRLRHFRAFADARLRLDDLTVLVGRNGAGKTSLMLALDFLRDAVTDSLVSALARRGGVQGIRQRQRAGKPYDVALALVLRAEGQRVAYGFVVGPSNDGNGFLVKEEFLRAEVGPSFHRKAQAFSSDNADVRPKLSREALLLPVVAGQDPLWTAALSTIRKARAYCLSPATIGSEPEIGSSHWLARDGGNAGDVLKRIESAPAVMKWLVRHLSAVTPGILAVHAVDTVIGRRLIYFQQDVAGGIQEFASGHMSDGTLRCLGILLALRQRSAPSLVFVDEIEDSIHPAALGTLLDAINSSLDRCQVIITSHSPEALTHPAVTAARVRIVDWRDGVSRIYAVAPEVAGTLRPPESVGRLLRSNALWPADGPSEVGPDFFGLPA